MTLIKTTKVKSQSFKKYSDTSSTKRPARIRLQVVLLQSMKWFKTRKNQNPKKKSLRVMTGRKRR